MREPYYYDPFANQPTGSSGAPQGSASGQPGGARQYDAATEAFRRDFAQFNHAYDLQKKTLRRQGNIMGLLITAYFLLQNIVVLPILFSDTLADAYYNSPAFSYGFTVIGVSVICVMLPFLLTALLLKKRGENPNKIIPDKKIGAKNFWAWSGIGLGLCVLINYLVNFLVLLVNTLGYDLTGGESSEPASAVECVLLLVATAIAPAFCEEVAMRCSAMQYLRKNGKVFAVVASSLIFGLLHGNVLQFIFASLVGAVLGYITMKTDSIAPAIFVHFANNFRSVFYDVIVFFANDSAADIAGIVLMAVYLVLAVFGLVVLIRDGSFRREPKDPLPMTTGRRLVTFFCVPGMILPLLCLVYFTVTTIVPIG